ncbi:MAG: Na+/H+ antiporter subunit E [Firmicutes bacterium]|nr:Na+/H+ antiporter subunit E [Bacillota bacterium]
MYKRQIVLFVALLLFWLLLSSEYDAQHIITGIVLAALVTWFWRDVSDLLPSQSLMKRFPATARFGLALLWEIIVGNYVVAKTILFNGSKLESGVVTFRPDLRTSWGRVILANSITLTPGTVTIDVNPDTGVFMVHGMTRSLREGLADGRLVRRIQALEGSKVK